ncbi:MAG: histidine kinase [Clostridiaceae bacterium]|nr:histidine kinase [Clostridiaceae bacterium]
MLVTVCAKFVIFLACAGLCINEYSTTYRSTAAILLAVVFASLYVVINQDVRIKKGSVSCENICSCLIFIYLIISVFVPEMAFFIPLLCFDMLTHPRALNMTAAFAGSIALLINTDGFPFFIFCILILLSVMLSYITESNISLTEKIKTLQDDSTYNDLLAKENLKIVQSNQDNMIYTATLKERNRIAREIHDNVGHLLTRSILQTGAAKTINKEEYLKKPLEDLHTTLNTAMDNIRKSVHDLHDEAIDTKAAIEEIINEDDSFKINFEYDVEADLSHDIKYSVIAIVKEALTNARRHSNGHSMQIIFREHPAFLQLIISDDGTDVKPSVSNGIGLTNIKERISALSGTIRITTDGGFKIFATIPFIREEQ